VRYDGKHAVGCITYKAPEVLPLLQGLTRLRVLRLETLDTINLNYTELAGFSALEEVRLGVVGPDQQIRFAAPNLLRYDLANSMLTRFNVSAIRADMPRLQILVLKSAKLASLLLDTDTTLRELTVSTGACEFLFELDWSLLPSLRELQLTCGQPMRRLATGMLPAFGRITKLNIYVSFTYIDIDAILDAYDIDIKHEFKMPSLKASQCTDQTSVARDFVLVCICVDPPFQGASHCPKLRPFDCPNSNINIVASQVCDGKKDCPDGYDEAFCDAQLELVGTTGVQCIDGLQISVRSGVMSSRLSPSQPSHLKDICYVSHGVVTSWSSLEGNYGRATVR
jgi:hypothetical protein